MFGSSYAPSGINYRSASEINTAMAGVYKHMSLAVIVSMLVSFYVGNSVALMEFFFTGAMKWLVIFAPLVMVFSIGFTLEKVSKSVAALMLYSFAALMGLSFATIFVVYNLGSIVTAFMGAAVLFGVMSIYGYFTKKDLSGFGSLLLVGLIAIIIASVINIFIGSTVFQMVISAIAIIVFLGLTAYDTQRIREMLSVDQTGNAEISSALSLYLNFINIFLSLLQLFGEKK
jgi:FtsH-binding integral membrane protein